ncbi:MAG: hypothetical protein QM689_06205 [Oscillospiraceae bacterium]
MQQKRPMYPIPPNPQVTKLLRMLFLIPLMLLVMFYIKRNENPNWIWTLELIFVAALLLFAVVINLLNFYQKKKLARFFARLEGEVTQNGYSDAYYQICREQYAIATKPLHKALYQIAYADRLAEGQRYDDAFAAFDSVDLSQLPPRYCALFFNDRLWITLQAGRVDEAQRLYAISREILSKPQPGTVGISIRHTLAVFELHRGNYAFAESELLAVKYATPVTNETLHMHCNLYLGLIYLRTNRKEYAREIAQQTIPLVRTPRDKDDLAKLLKLVDAAYVQERMPK